MSASSAGSSVWRFHFHALVCIRNECSNDAASHPAYTFICLCIYHIILSPLRLLMHELTHQQEVAELMSQLSVVKSEACATKVISGRSVAIGPETKGL